MANHALGDSLVTRDYPDTRLARTEADLRAVEYRLTIKLGGMIVVTIGAVTALVTLL